MNNIPSWGTRQGREGDQMNRGDLGLAVAAWAVSWICIIGIVSFVYQVLA